MGIKMKNSTALCKYSNSLLLF